jgi:hypothetical protein
VLVNFSGILHRKVALKKQPKTTIRTRDGLKILDRITGNDLQLRAADPAALPFRVDHYDGS